MWAIAVMAFGAPRRAPQKLPLSCGSGGGESNHEAKILGLFLNAADFVFSIFLLVVVHPLVDVLFSIAQHTVDEAREDVGHRRNGFWCTQTGSSETSLILRQWWR